MKIIVMIYIIDMIPDIIEYIAHYFQQLNDVGEIEWHTWEALFDEPQSKFPLIVDWIWFIQSIREGEDHAFQKLRIKETLFKLTLQHPKV